MKLTRKHTTEGGKEFRLRLDAISQHCVDHITVIAREVYGVTVDPSAVVRMAVQLIEDDVSQAAQKLQKLRAKEDQQYYERAKWEWKHNLQAGTKDHQADFKTYPEWLVPLLVKSGQPVPSLNEIDRKWRADEWRAWRGMQAGEQPKPAKVELPELVVEDVDDVGEEQG